MKQIGNAQLAGMLRGAVAEIRAHHELLSELDSHGGDGDHGTTMLRAVKEIEKALDSGADTPSTLLSAVGWGLLGVDGGATGPLFGAFFNGMAEAADGAEQLDGPVLASAFEAGLAGIVKYSKAKVGDKTMLDALAPAVSAARTAADAGADAGGVLAEAAKAAQSGAEGTKALQARFGRAKNIGEASIGHQDAGATSVAFMFKGFYQGVS